MDLTCAIALDQYYREHVAHKAIDRRRCEYAIDALNEFFSDIPLAHVDIPMCREYRSHRDSVVDATVRRELGVLSAAAHHALKWRRISIDRMPSIELPPDSAPRKVWLMHDELEHLLHVAENNDRRVFRFLQLAYHTASRRRAIEALQWVQVDLSARRINLQAPGKPVTKKRCPIVPISVNMAAILESMKMKATTGFVLVKDDRIYQAFDSVAMKAGLAKLPNKGLREAGRLTPHILRHTRATHLLQAGKNPWAVANLLGDSLQTVLRVYGHACSNYMEDVVS